MKKSAVFLLINAMSVPEKRYFILFSKRHKLGSQNKYILLFQTICSQRTDDEAGQKKVLEAAGFASSYLAADKLYLYNQILKSFQAYHSRKTTTIFQTEQLVLVEILYEKGLYELCRKEIAKALKTALKVENFSLVIELLTWKRKVYGYTKGFKAAYEVNLEIAAHLQKMQNQIAYTNLYYESLRLRFMEFKARSKRIVEEFERLLTHPLLSTAVRTDSLIAQIRYHLIYSNYYFVLNHKQEETAHLHQLIQLMENSGYYDLENPFDYLYVYYYWLEAVRRDKPGQFSLYLDHLRAFAGRVVISREKVKAQIELFVGLAEMDNLLDNNAFEQAYGLIAMRLEALRLQKNVIEPAWVIKQYFLFAKAAMGTGHYAEALGYLNTIFNEYKEEQRADYFNYARILFMLVHFSLGNYGLIEYIHKNTYLYFMKRNRLYKLEKVVLDFFKDVGAEGNEPLLLKRVEDLAKRLSNIQNENYETPLFALFDLTLWVKSYLSQTTMNQVALGK